MAYISNWRGRSLAASLTLSLLTACGSLSKMPVVVQEAPTIPQPDSTLLQSEQESSENFSQRVQDFLKRAEERLQSLRLRPLPCKPSSNKCA